MGSQHTSYDGGSGGGAGGWGGDAFPGSEPQAVEDRNQRLDAEVHDGWDQGEDYQFVYANGEFHISDTHDLHDLLEHTGAGPDHAGPLAVGKVHVDQGKATFEVASNVHAHGVARILKDYCKQVGWAWGGMTDAEGEPVATGSEFAPVRSFYISAGRNPGEAIFSSKAISGELSGAISGVVHVADHRAYVHRLDAAVFEGVKEWAEDEGFILLAGNDNVLKKIEDLEQSNTYTPEWKNDDDHFGFSEPEDERQPGGVFKCPSCSRIFHSWGTYLLHRRQEEPQSDETQDEGKFPTLDMDATFPPHTSDPLTFYEGRTGRIGNTKFLLRGAANPPMGKDMLPSPVPFIYDVQEDSITTGQPGARHSDIQGRFTPGGIVEGTYEPKGKLFIRSMTNMPYTVRHMLELWYYQHPEFEITSVHLMDDAGKKTKLATADLPPEPGQSPIPEGTLRFFHYTHPDNLDSIRQHGLLYNKGRGDSGTGVDEPSKGVWASNQPPTLDHLQNKPYVEFHVRPEQVSRNAEHWWHEDPFEWNTPERNHHIIVHGDVPPEQITAIHEPWHQHLRYLMENYPTRESTESVGGPDSFDWAMDPERGGDEQLGRAIQEWKRRISKVSSMDVGTYIQRMVAANPTAWRVQKALQAAGGVPYAVGGAVRDAVMGKEPKDIDMMVTGIPPDEVRSVLGRLPGRVDLTGKDFGVFRYKEQGGDEIEIALPRRERAGGGGHKDFDVQADHTMTPEEDLFRRDFTANAMAVELPTGMLIDPFNGHKDVQDRHLRTLNTKSLKDDPLRVVRALVALSRHGLYPDDQTKQQMTEASDGLKLLPQERIQAELDKLFKGDNPSEAIRLAQETGTLPHIFPEVARTQGYSQNNPHHELELYDHLLNVMDRAKERKPHDPDFALAGLLHDIGKIDSHWTQCQDCEGKFSGHVKPCPLCGSENTSGHFYHDNESGYGQHHEDVGAQQASDALRRLKYPKDRIDRVQALIQHHMFPAFASEKGARKFLQNVGPHADDLMDLRWADQGGKSEYPTDPALSINTQRELINKARAEKAPTERSMLAINGGDLIAAGVPQGPQIGAALKALMEAVVDNPELNTKDGLLGIARGMGFIKAAAEKIPRVLYNKFNVQNTHPSPEGPELPFIFDPHDDVVHLGPANSYHWELISKTPELRQKYDMDDAFTQAPFLTNPDHVHGRVFWNPKQVYFYGKPTPHNERILKAFQKGTPEMTERPPATYEDEDADWT